MSAKSFERNSLVDINLLDQRKDVIRRLLYGGKSVNQIIIALDKRDFLEGCTYTDKVRIVKQTVNSIKQEDSNRMLSVRKDSDTAWAEYVGRMEFLYELAIEHADIVSAIGLSKDIARAHGIRTDQPIEVKTDIGEMLAQAAMMNRRQEPKKIEEPKQAINLLTKDYKVKAELPAPSEK